MADTVNVKNECRNEGQALVYSKEAKLWNTSECKELANCLAPETLEGPMPYVSPQDRTLQIEASGIRTGLRRSMPRGLKDFGTGHMLVPAERLGCWHCK